MMIPVSVQLNIPFRESEIRLRLKLPAGIRKQAHDARILLRQGKGKDMVEKMRDLGESLERFERRIKNR